MKSFPVNWSVHELAELVTIKSGSTPSKARPDFWGGDTPWITARDMKTPHISSTTASLTSIGAEKARVMPAGTVFVLTRGMTLFRDLPVVRNTKPAAFNQDVKALISNPNLDANFLACTLIARKSELLQTVTQAGHGTGRLDTEKLETFPLPLPPLNEQRKIAAVIATWDEAIEQTNALKDALLRQRDWLRNTALTGRKQESAWKHVPLSEVMTEHKLRSSGTEEVFSVSVHRGLINQVEHLGRSFAAAKTSHYNLVQPGDVVYTKSPTGGFPFGIIKQSTISHDVIVSPLYGVYAPATEAIGAILNAVFESPRLARNYLAPLVQKGAKNTISITNGRFLEGLVKLPTDPEMQTRLAETFKVSFKEIGMLDVQIELLRTQKSAIMQKLLTGDIRVAVGEEPNDG
ncbi:restriction endonuclease subunit S [Arthrobacter sp. AQ5-05]|uniref:restriction endonuclease subunit S n=1 Tax=Arthrobacter sp. AQ5-05 TaxID=2184581 RepID=UPI000DCD1E13|nr:restriction endonuclease subunit S [Arthrobacter sp. AQ5-05]RAX50310.1 restriction endonuclease subunit S [Arthrobacter sp. AQ5-05]